MAVDDIKAPPQFKIPWAAIIWVVVAIAIMCWQ